MSSWQRENQFNLCNLRQKQLKNCEALAKKIPQNTQNLRQFKDESVNGTKKKIVC